jgi:hypothetical protein
MEEEPVQQRNCLKKNSTANKITCQWGHPEMTSKWTLKCDLMNKIGKKKINTHFLLNSYPKRKNMSIKKNDPLTKNIAKLF